MTDEERRERYATAIHNADTLRADPLSRDHLRADAAMAVADEEITAALNAERSNAARYLFELDAAWEEHARLHDELEGVRVDLREMAEFYNSVCAQRNDLRAELSQVRAATLREIANLAEAEGRKNGLIEEIALGFFAAKLRHMATDQTSVTEPETNGPTCCDACARSPRQRAAHARLAAPETAPDADEVAHVVADDSDDPEHVNDCPGCEEE